MCRIDTDAEAEQQVEALRPDALGSYAELRATLEVSPWSGDPVNDRNPDGPVRTFAFGRHGQGLVAYLILEEQRRVDVLSVLRLG